MIRITRPSATAFAGAVLLMILVASGAGANEWNDRTELAFSDPVMVPGATLPAGTYEFVLAASRGNRHIVQIRKKGARS